jgi:hypothetical protein
LHGHANAASGDGICPSGQIRTFIIINSWPFVDAGKKEKSKDKKHKNKTGKKVKEKREEKEEKDEKPEHTQFEESSQILPPESATQVCLTFISDYLAPLIAKIFKLLAWLIMLTLANYVYSANEL